MGTKNPRYFIIIKYIFSSRKIPYFAHIDKHYRNIYDPLIFQIKSVIIHNYTIVDTLHNIVLLTV
jgi:hypothetical protein